MTQPRTRWGAYWKSMAAFAATALSACSQSPLTLPADSVQRAAHCSIFQTLYLRQSGSSDAPVTLEQFSHGMQPALIEASRGDEVDEKLLASITDAVEREVERISTRDWRSLGDQCIAAYPETLVKPALPSDKLTARVQCWFVSDFLAKAVLGNAENSEAAEARFRATADRIIDYWDYAPQPGFETLDELKAAIKSTGHKGFLLGDPVGVADLCERRFGS